MRTIVGVAAGAGLAALIAVLPTGPARAGDDAAAAAYRERSMQHVPKGWQVRARWRDKALVAFLLPPTFAVGFDTFYDTAAEVGLARDVCPPADDPLWGRIGPDQDLAVEPQVLGKGALRISCRATNAEAPST